jgi:hypothetical protein
MPGADASQGGGEGVDVPNADGMTATEIKICEMTGVTHEAYKKQRALTSGAPLPKVN